MSDRTRYRTRNQLVLAGCALVATLVSAAANAEYITYTFSGAVTVMGSTGPAGPPPIPGQPPIPPQLPPNLPPEFTSFSEIYRQPISGYVTVNNEAIDRNPNEYDGAYSGPAVVPLFYVTFLDHTFFYDYRAPQPNTYSIVHVQDLDTPRSEGLPPSNFIGISADAGAGFFGDSPASNYRARLNLGHSEYDDLDLIDSPAMPSDLSVYGSWLLDLSLFDPTTGYSVTYQAQVNLTRYVAPVPLPATAALVGLGLLGVGFARRRTSR